MCYVIWPSALFSRPPGAFRPLRGERRPDGGLHAVPRRRHADRPARPGLPDAGRARRQRAAIGARRSRPPPRRATGPRPVRGPPRPHAAAYADAVARLASVEIAEAPPSHRGGGGPPRPQAVQLVPARPGRPVLSCSTSTCPTTPARLRELSAVRPPTWPGSGGGAPRPAGDAGQPPDGRAHLLAPPLDPLRTADRQAAFGRPPPGPLAVAAEAMMERPARGRLSRCALHTRPWTANLCPWSRTAWPSTPPGGRRRPMSWRPACAAASPRPPASAAGSSGGRSSRPALVGPALLGGWCRGDRPGESAADARRRLREGTRRLPGLGDYAAAKDFFMQALDHSPWGAKMLKYYQAHAAALMRLGEQDSAT